MVMKKESCFLLLLSLQFACPLFGQQTVKLFNSTGNKETFTEVYLYNETATYTQDNFHSSSGMHRNFVGNPQPFFRDTSSASKNENHFTDKLSEFLIHQDSVQMQLSVMDSVSPILILQFLKEELEAQGIRTYYPVKGGEKADYLVEINSCECRFQINSLQTKKRRNRYTGSYRVEYYIKWTDKKEIPTESWMQEHITYDWNKRHKTEMEDIPSLTDTMTMLCDKIAKAKAKQIINQLKKSE